MSKTRKFLPLWAISQPLWHRICLNLPKMCISMIRSCGKNFSIGLWVRLGAAVLQTQENVKNAKIFANFEFLLPELLWSDFFQILHTCSKKYILQDEQIKKLIFNLYTLDIVHSKWYCIKLGERNTKYKRIATWRNDITSCKKEKTWLIALWITILIYYVMSHGLFIIYQQLTLFV